MKFTVREYLLHAFCFMITILFVFFWTGNSVLADYNLQLTAFLVAAYFVLKLFLRETAGTENRTIIDAVVFTAVLLLILSSTGSLGSSFFFLIYFLLFGIALLFEPPTTITLTLGLVIFFANSLNSLHAALQLISLLLVTPMAIFFSRQYLRLLESKQKIKILAKKQKWLYREAQNLEGNLRQEETNSLLWLSLEFKNSILKIIHQTSTLLSDIGRLSPLQKEILQSIHESAKQLLKSGEKLLEKIDKETDK